MSQYLYKIGKINIFSPKVSSQNDDRGRCMPRLSWATLGVNIYPAKGAWVHENLPQYPTEYRLCSSPCWPSLSCPGQNWNHGKDILQILSTALIQHTFLPKLHPKWMSRTLACCPQVLSPASPALLCTMMRGLYRGPSQSVSPDSHLCLANSRLANLAGD